MELVANDLDTRAPFSYGNIPLKHAIRGFYSVELYESTFEYTEGVLVNLLEHTFVAEEGNLEIKVLGKLLVFSRRF